MGEQQLNVMGGISMQKKLFDDKYFFLPLTFNFVL